jgi:hypothetical protein
MKTHASKKLVFKSFYDFTLFAVVPVQRGAVLTPRGVVGRGRVSPLRKRGHRNRETKWGASRVCFVPYSISGLPKQESGEIEEASWAASARRARLSWMDENAY